VIEKGITEGYKERLFEGRYPVAFILVTTDPAVVDVNIHPNKREIRFHDDKAVTDVVREAVKNALGTKEAVVQAGDYFVRPERKAEAEKSVPEEQVDIKHILSSLRQESSVTDNIKMPESKAAPEAVPAVPESRERAELEIEECSSRPFDFDELQITGCIFDTYITCVDKGSFYLLDQHAAHERIFYERLVGEYLSEKKLKQPILTPLIIDVPLSVRENQYTWLDSLNDMGYTMEEFGPNSYIIKEIPQFMEISEAEDFVRYYIENVGEGDDLGNKVVIDKLITRSCKSAVKAHDHLSDPEIRALIDELRQCRNPFSCPHGRPTFVRFSIYDIEKMFKRV
jgi:DNA mismatch repair protein MutL